MYLWYRFMWLLKDLIWMIKSYSYNDSCTKNDSIKDRFRDNETATYKKCD